jgi:hypothetical protein
LLDISKEAGLEVRTEKIKCTTNSQHKIGDRSFKMWQRSDTWE